MCKLSILIPTYNRRTQLLRVLSLLHDQPEIDTVQIVIIDNASNYDIESAIREQIGDDAMMHISIVHNAYNTGQAGNLANLFLYCSTEWAWTLSDDDTPHPDALRILIRDIERHPDVAFTKYTCDLTPVPLKDLVVDNIHDYWRYYAEDKAPMRDGEYVWVSNNLVNVTLLRDYLQYAHIFGYTYVGYLIPILYALAEGKAKARFSPDMVALYRAPEEGQHWSHHKVFLGLSTALHLQLGLSDELQRVMVRTFLHWDHLSFAYFVFNTPNFRSRALWLIYKQIYEMVYRYEKGYLLEQRFIYFISWLRYRWGLSYRTVERLHRLVFRRAMRLFPRG